MQPEVIEREKQYRARPDVKARMNEYARKYQQTPYVKQYHKEYDESKKINDKFLINEASDKEFLNAAADFIDQRPYEGPSTFTRKLLERKRKIKEEYAGYDPMVRAEYLAKNPFPERNKGAKMQDKNEYSKDYYNIKKKLPTQLDNLLKEKEYKLKRNGQWVYVKESELTANEKLFWGI